MSELNLSLKMDLIANYEQIIPTIKAIANEKRFLILIIVLDGPKSFQYLLDATKLQKTALSNHLTQLIDSKLIEKPDFGRYQLLIDGKAYIRNLYQTWKNSISNQETRLQKEQERGLSVSFLNSFFHK
jgi:DNA-binding HxlR family transcriptional regulator